MANIEIIPVTVDNVDEAIGFAQQVMRSESDDYAIHEEFRASVGLEPEFTNVQKIMGIHDAEYILATVDGQPAGFSGTYAYKQAPNDRWLGWTGVSDKFGRMGIGEKLVSEAFGRAHNRGATTNRIWTSEEEQYACARRLYARLGFTEEHYAPGAAANDGRSLSRVFSQPAVAGAPVRSWADTAYTLADLERFDVPRLNQLVAHNREPLTDGRKPLVGAPAFRLGGNGAIAAAA